MEVARLFVTVGANLSEFTKGMQTVDQRIRTVSQGLKNFGSAMTKAVTLPAMAAGAAIGGLVISSGQWADELLDLSAATGVNVESLQQYRYAAMLAGTESDALATAIGYMNRQMVDNEEFSARATRMIEGLGIATHDTAGVMRNTEDIAWDLALALAGIDDEAERARLGAQAFGRQWDSVAPIIALGREELEKIRDVQAFSQEELQQLDQFRQAWDRVKYAVQQAGIELALMITKDQDIKGLVSTVTDAISRIVEKVGEWIDAWRELDPEMQKIIGWGAGLVVAIGPLASILGNIGFAMIGISKALPLMLGPIGAAVAAGTFVLFSNQIGELAENFAKAAGATDEMAGKIKNIIQAVGQSARLAIFGPIVLFFDDFADVLEKTGGVIDKFVGILKNLIDHLRSLRDIAKEAFSAMSSALGLGGGFSMGGGDVGGTISAGARFHTGGVFRAPRLGGEGMALLKDGERIIPAGVSVGGSQPTVINVTVNQNITDKTTADYAADKIINTMQFRGLAGAFR